MQSRLCLGRSRSPFPQGASGVRSDPGPPPRRCAKKRVCGLEAAISAMIVNGFDETSSLKDSLAKAKRNAEEPSLSIQLKGGDGVRRPSSQAFGCPRRPTCSVGEGVGRRRNRVQRLEAEVSVAPSTRPAELDVELSQLKAKLAMMEAEQACWREGVVRAPNSERMSDAPSIAGIPPMPHHAEEVEQWLIDRNCELRSALHCQDTHMIAHIGALIAKGASKLSIVEPTEGQSRSSLMAALITEADAKRRCIEASPYEKFEMDFEECELGRLRTQDRGCFADIEDQGEVLLPLRMMMRRCSLKTSEM